MDGTYQPPLDGDASYRSNNVILKAAVAQQNGYLTLLDWHTYADDTGGLLQSDGAHLTVAGAYAVGDFIHSAVDVLWGAKESNAPSELAHVQRTPQAGGYVISPSPVRLLDTRGLNGPLAGGEAVRVLVPGGTAFAAASVNVTAVGVSAGGFFTAYSCTAAVPNVSTLNFAAARPGRRPRWLPWTRMGDFVSPPQCARMPSLICSASSIRRLPVPLSRRNLYVPLTAVPANYASPPAAACVYRCRLPARKESRWTPLRWTLRRMDGLP